MPLEAACESGTQKVEGSGDTRGRFVLASRAMDRSCHLWGVKQGVVIRSALKSSLGGHEETQRLRMAKGERAVQAGVLLEPFSRDLSLPPYPTPDSLGGNLVIPTR